MTKMEKLEMLRALMDDGSALPPDETLLAYICLSGKEILQWRYHLVGGVPDTVTEVPARYEVTQIYAVLAGYTHAGAEGQTQHSENGISRTFKQTDMVDYIRQNVRATARVGAV